TSLHVRIARLRVRLHADPLRKRVGRLRRTSNMRERIGRCEPQLRRAARTPRRISARARRFELYENVIGEIRTAHERGPKRRELVKLDPRMLGRSGRVSE